MYCHVTSLTLEWHSDMGGSLSSEEESQRLAALPSQGRTGDEFMKLLGSLGSGTRVSPGIAWWAKSWPDALVTRISFHGRQI